MNLKTDDCKDKAIGWTTIVFMTGDGNCFIHSWTIRNTASLGSNAIFSATFPRSFISMKWISCVIVLLFWAWCFWPRYCSTCCCHPFARAAWSLLLKLKGWGWWPPLLLRFPPSTCPSAPDSYLGTLHCSSEKLYLLMELDDRYYQGELIQLVFCLCHYYVPNHLSKRVNTQDSGDGLLISAGVLLTYSYNMSYSPGLSFLWNREKLATTKSLENKIISLCRLQVVLLHGQAFTSKTWEELGTMALLAINGYQALAMDLPGRHIISINISDNHDYLLKLYYTQSFLSWYVWSGKQINQRNIFFV